MWPTQWIYVVLGLLLAISNNAQTCSNDLPGVEDAGTCCVAACGTCGGSGCGDRARDAGLSGDDCCVGAIRDAGVYCDDSKAAPCLIGSVQTDVMCSNGLSGMEADGVCCVAGCPQCGGAGCGSMASTVGLSSSDCCVGAITSAGESCDDTMMAPCVIDDGEEGPCGPALTITLSWTEVESDLDLYVTEPGGQVVRFANMVGDVGFLDMDATEGPGIETYTVFRGLDPDMVDVIGTYQLEARRFLTGPTETVWTLTATLIERVVLVETGNFTESNRSGLFPVDVTAYDPTCQNGTEAFASGSRDSTSSPEDKLP